MFVPMPAKEAASFGKMRYSRMQTREGEGLIVCRLLYMTYLLYLELDFSFLLYFLQRRAINGISVAFCCSSLLAKLYYKYLQFRGR